MSLAPVGIFVFNRPQHTYNLLKSITNCSSIKNIRFYVFSDFYSKPEDKQKVLEVRSIVHSFKNNLNILLIKYKKNKGLYKSIICGVDYIIKRNSKVIVLEDDLILDNSFFKYINLSLTKYKNKKDILQISGYSYPINCNSNDAYFLNLTSCWGWATWSDRWTDFIKFLKNKKLIQEEYNKIQNDFNKKSNFNVSGSYNYLKMLKKQLTSQFNSWGILFYLFSFYKNFLNLFPPHTLVENRGFDGSGSHKSTANVFNRVVSNGKSKKISYPRIIKLNTHNQKQVGIFLLKELSLVKKTIHYLFK